MVLSREINRVVVCGAGPVGLSTAVALAQQNVPVTVIERQQEIADDPRAATLHPPTLEILQQLGVIGEIEKQGLRADEFQFRDRQSQNVIAQFDLAHLCADTRYPYCIQLEQHKLVALLRVAIEQQGLDIELQLGTELVALTAQSNAIQITLADQSTLRVPWLIGCDGGRSLVRKGLNIEFSGFTYRERFLVLTTPHEFSEYGFVNRNYLSDPSEWCALFQVPGTNANRHWRVVFPTPADVSDAECLSDSACTARLKSAFGGLSAPLNFPLLHRNLYTVSQRVAATFRSGRVLLAGDAAHVNNPLGGLGMNSGIHDGFELAESLARVWHSDADQGLLDRYDRRRRTVANEFVQQQTIRNKKTLEERDPKRPDQALAELRTTAEDPRSARAFLLNSSLIASVRRSAAIQ